MSKKLTTLTLCILFYSIPVTLFAKPSFDCSKATTKDEILICSNDELGELDSKLAKSYKALSQILDKGETEKLVKLQRNWIQTRQKIVRDLPTELNKSDNLLILQLKSFYKDRINAIDSTYYMKTIENKNPNATLCSFIENVIDQYNTDIFRHLIYEEYIGDYVDIEKFPSLFLYETVPLFEEDLSAIPIGIDFIPLHWKGYKQGGTLTKVDLNNDHISEYRYFYSAGSANCQRNIILGNKNGDDFFITRQPKLSGEGEMCGAYLSFIEYKGEIYTIAVYSTFVEVYEFSKDYEIKQLCKIQLAP